MYLKSIQLKPPIIFFILLEEDSSSFFSSRTSAARAFRFADSEERTTSENVEKSDSQLRCSAGKTIYKNLLRVRTGYGMIFRADEGTLRNLENLQSLLAASASVSNPPPFCKIKKKHDESQCK